MGEKRGWLGLKFNEAVSGRGRGATPPSPPASTGIPFRTFLSVVLLSCAVLAPSRSFGAWTEFAETEDRKYFHDPQTAIKRSGSVEVWTLQDMFQRTNFGAMSVRVRYELDCRDDRYRVLAIGAFFGRMGEGDLIRSGEGGGWERVPMDSVIDDLMSFYCRQ